jgi:aspartyl/asparaginyl beta-hydroxylase (cupin superfamily)
MKANRNIIFFKAIDWSRRIYDRQVNNPAYLDPEEYFPEYKLIEEHWEELRDEIINIIETSKPLPKFHEIDKGQSFISNNDGISWNLFAVKFYGIWHKHNLQKCPKTKALFENMKQVKTINYSILAPGKHIPPHRGPYRGILRYQIALKVPKEGNCQLFVDHKPYHWTEGKSVLFDDTYVHEVKNETEETRIALLLDIKRHDFGPFLKAIDWIYYKMIQLVILTAGGIRKSKVYH